ncbi:MAG TPA: hypothetical protein VLF60_03490 [Candidatus Saccharimonadales bacterium]|nr:hypothetical protein [Candidatus Saccharimonadales bacterium]
MREYVTPTIHVLAALASIACVFFIMNAGYLYMTSTGQPEKMEHAKDVLKKAGLGLVIVLAAATLTTILTNAYGSQQTISNATLPNMQAIPPVENGLVDVIIKAVTGFLNNIIQTIATPFLAALDFFTKSTPLMAQNPSVFNLWLAVVGIADVLFVVIIALLGFHVMSAATFGFDEIEIKHLLPRIALIFLFMNTSIFLIDAIIGLSNVLITAINTVSGAASVWDTLTQVVEKSGGQGAAALLIMMTFLILSIILLVYYVGRLITLFIGAVLSPLVALVWLVPGFRDFAETAAKTYITTIFVLFVHVVILQLAASLLTGMSAGSGNNLSGTLMAMVVGLATIVALLRTQGVMMQFSYVSMGSRNMRRLGGQFMTGVSYMTGKGGRAAVNSMGNKIDSVQKVRAINRIESEAARTGKPQSISYETKKGVNATHIAEPNPKGSSKSTGTTYEAPKAAKSSRSKKSSGGKTA